MKRSILFSLITTLFCAGCSDDETATMPTCAALSSSSSSGTSSTSSGTGGDAATSSSSSSASAAAGGSASTGTGGNEPFQATCKGTVICQGIGACADWAYSVADNGPNTNVGATVTPLIPNPPPQACSATVTNFGSVQTANIVSFMCGGGTWTFDLDRSTMIVYIKQEGTGPVLSWTQPCQ